MTLHFFTTFSRMAIQTIKILTAIAVIYWVIRAGTGLQRPRGGEGERRPGRWARISEAIVLALLGGLAFLLCTLSIHPGWVASPFAYLHPEARLEYFAMMTVAALALVITVTLVARTGRTSLAAILLGVTLACYGTWLNSADKARWLKRPLGENLNDPARLLWNTSEIRLVKKLHGCEFSFEGAELWLNGAYLGKTPVKLTIEEFKRRVPHWAGPPEGFRAKPVKVAQPTPWGENVEYYQRWFRLPVHDFEGPGQRGAPLAPGPAGSKVFEPEICYGQARLDGEQGYCTGSYSGHGGEVFVQDVGAAFPQAEARLDRLLAQARLKDYAVDEAWIRALDLFGEPAWSLLEQLAQKEPGFKRVRRERLALRMGLGELKTPGQNWDVFERVMKEADRLGRYATDTTAGQAIEVVAPNLDPARLADLAVKMIPRYGVISVGYSQKEGRLEFGTTRTIREGSQQMTTSDHFDSITVEGNGEPYPPRAFVLAHAIWVLQRQLKNGDAARPTVFEGRVAPQILRWHYNGNLALRLAAALDGEAVDHFLMRQDWHTPYIFGQSDWADQISLGMGTFANKWFYLLATRMDKYGQAFRRDHTDMVMDLADAILKQNMRMHMPSLPVELPDFLFYDAALGAQSLGFKYWPRYRGSVLEQKAGIFIKEMHYLVRLDPLTTAEMYGQAVRDMREEDERIGSFIPDSGLFGIRQELETLAPPQRTAALKALNEAIGRELAGRAGDDQAAPGYEDFLRKLRTEFEKQLFLAGDPESIDSLIEELALPGATARREEITAWLAQTDYYPPLLLERLAKAEDPELRRMALAPVLKAPTRDHRELLARLLADPDPIVRQAAQETQAALNKLRGS